MEATLSELSGSSSSRRGFLGHSAALVALAGASVAVGPAHAAEGDNEVKLRLAMRKLWEDHITYTRNYIISDIGGLGDKGAVAARLMKNQEDIGDAIKPYYGAAAGTKLTKLLKEHITVATEVVTAAKSGNSAQLGTAQQKWSANGREIAAFLASANPNWPKGTLESMMQKHLDLTTGEAASRLKKDWAADIRSYDEGHDHMLMFADALTDGIVKQFPNKFSS
jgi:hypothetical protein